jgi:hypothetical protein
MGMVKAAKVNGTIRHRGIPAITIRAPFASIPDALPILALGLFGLAT